MARLVRGKSEPRVIEIIVVHNYGGPLGRVNRIDVEPGSSVVARLVDQLSVGLPPEGRRVTSNAPGQGIVEAGVHKDAAVPVTSDFRPLEEGPIDDEN